MNYPQVSIPMQKKKENSSHGNTYCELFYNDSVAFGKFKNEITVRHDNLLVQHKIYYTVHFLFVGFCMTLKLLLPK